ncbi:TonB-dependent receptor [Shewanella yunxiaonensis]|uniref:TonB-dependent receptor n=1 Tax=Shewanella yunxiaonensis TaxID=2829809 RepID=A0ABX7YUG4_9GAMM|nr:TonB-dependent receptor [Shewanella yunxiaonensis]QUN06307.1 TonB-dependent receptor [Shewanella yunxiaonensis]
MMKKATFRRTLVAASVSALFAISIPVFAASNTDGSIQGAVITTADAPLGNANIVIKNKDTGLTRSVSADASGKYRIPRLPIGTYTVTVSADGYDDKVIDDVVVTIGGNASVTSVMNQTGMERLSVVGSRVAAIDTTSSESSLVIGQEEIERLPLPKDVTSVALLAPGTTRGDARFGNFASFGGASVAENAFYINGLNVTNFRNGLGFSNVPFDFYDQFEVKTGGYSAEFGRSTGGVVNAVVKRGSNDWEFGGNIRWRPDSLSEHAPNSYNSEGDLYIDNSHDSNEVKEGNIYASGPIIKDKLFFFAMYQPNSKKQDYAETNSELISSAKSDNPFWGLKLDWNIAENHTLEFLAFSDSDKQTTQTSGSSDAIDKTGGDNYVTTYTGQWTDDFTAKFTYGVNKYNLSSTTDSETIDQCNMIIDVRDEASSYYNGCVSPSAYFVSTGEDERKEFRADFEWVINENHTLTFGYDQENNKSVSDQFYTGPDGVYWVYYDVGDPTVGATLANGATTPVGVTQYARSRQRTVGGSFKTKSEALYVEDTWTIADDITLNLGLRWDSFDNMNSNGDSFAKIDNMIAPRIGVSWDINGNGESKLFANVGRYYLPVASNTNVRLSGNEYDVRQYYVLEGTEMQEINGVMVPTPILGDKIGGDSVLANGEIPDTETIVDQNLDPMYQDEYIIGYQAMINEDWSWGIKGTQRKLNGAIDDMTIDGWIEKTYGYTPSSSVYVLGNPGEDMTVKVDTTGNGDYEMVTIPGDELGYPKATRTYNAIDLNLSRSWADDWTMNITYTWSQSYGNTEGLVKSDNAQTDAGLTQDFDFPVLMDGADGYLPNDRRHMLKVFGAYQLTENLTVGANVSIESGRPLNKFGIGSPYGIPDYGDTYYTLNEDGTYTWNQRGSAGRTDWVYRLDLSASYNWDITDDVNVILKANVYNVFNSHATIREYEYYEQGDPGQLDPNYGTTTAYQTPRYVEFSASIKF